MTKRGIITGILICVLAVLLSGAVKYFIVQRNINTGKVTGFTAAGMNRRDQRMDPARSLVAAVSDNYDIPPDPASEPATEATEPELCEVWQETDGRWYYYDHLGYIVKNSWIDNYYVGADGAMLVDTMTPDGYYVDKDGLWVEPELAELASIKDLMEKHNTNYFQIAFTKPLICEEHADNFKVKGRISLQYLLPSSEVEGKQAGDIIYIAGNPYRLASVSEYLGVRYYTLLTRDLLFLKRTQNVNMREIDDAYGIYTDHDLPVTYPVYEGDILIKKNAQIRVIKDKGASTLEYDARTAAEFFGSQEAAEHSFSATEVYADFDYAGYLMILTEYWQP